MLGLEQDYAGSIENKDLPALMRKLIQLKNSDRSQYAEPGSQSGGKMTTSTDAEGMSTIGRSGPTMYNMGTTDSQITQYVDQLIKIIKFAQDNDADFGWG
jgi:hypothetical protein